MNTVDIGSQVDNYFGYTCIGNFISNMVDLAITVAGVSVLIYLVWGGIQWITSGGDKTKTEEARNRISSAITGLAIVVISFAVWKIILYFFGINIDALCTANPLGN